MSILLNVDISNGPITTGQGEYVVFRQVDGKAKPLSREDFEKVYPTLAAEFTRGISYG